ncbi:MULTISPECIES: hypothetical protein [Delftia]|uniref:hypothetical protein n=1 Tax=Delftia TaxID=80865 RepID=UPI00115FCA65|nr:MULTISPECIES: hypothetical protein [Delftia]
MKLVAEVGATCISVPWKADEEMCSSWRPLLQTIAEWQAALPAALAASKLRDDLRRYPAEMHLSATVALARADEAAQGAGGAAAPQ